MPAVAVRWWVRSSAGRSCCNNDGTSSPPTPFQRRRQLRLHGELGRRSSETATVKRTVNTVAVIANDAGHSCRRRLSPSLCSPTPASSGATSDRSRAVGAAANGTVDDRRRNQVIYTPNADFNGADSFAYTGELGRRQPRRPPSTSRQPGGRHRERCRRDQRGQPRHRRCARQRQLRGATLDASRRGAARQWHRDDRATISTPTANFNGAASFSLPRWPGAASEPPRSSNLAVTAVNDAPVPGLGNNAFVTITDGGTLAVGAGNLSATDVDDAAGTLVFTVGGVSHGYFVLVSTRRPGDHLHPGRHRRRPRAVRARRLRQRADFTIYVPTATAAASDRIVAQHHVHRRRLDHHPAARRRRRQWRRPRSRYRRPVVAAALPATLARRSPASPRSCAARRAPQDDGGEDEAEAEVVDATTTTAASVEKRIVAEWHSRRCA